LVIASISRDSDNKAFKFSPPVALLHMPGFMLKPDFSCRRFGTASGCALRRGCRFFDRRHCDGRKAAEFSPIEPCLHRTVWLVLISRSLRLADS
jgi:hypothetical protein